MLSPCRVTAVCVESNHNCVAASEGLSVGSLVFEPGCTQSYSAAVVISLYLCCNYVVSWAVTSPVVKRRMKMYKYCQVVKCLAQISTKQPGNTLVDTNHLHPEIVFNPTGAAVTQDVEQVIC